MKIRHNHKSIENRISFKHGIEKPCLILIGFLFILMIVGCYPPGRSPTLLSSQPAVISQETTELQKPGQPERITPESVAVSFLPFELKDNEGLNNGDLVTLAVGIAGLDQDSAFLFGEIRYAGGSLRSLILRTSDAGQSWREVSDPFESSSVQEMSLVDDGKGWALVMWTLEDPGVITLFHTEDAGESWHVISEVPKDYWYGYPIKMEFSDELHGQINLVYDQGLPETNRIAFVTTSDGGITWNETGGKPFTLIPTSQVSKMEYYERLSSYIQEYGSDNAQSRTKDGSSWRIHLEKAKDQVVIERQLDGREWTVQASIPATYLYQNGNLVPSK